MCFLGEDSGKGRLGGGEQEVEPGKGGCGGGGGSGRTGGGEREQEVEVSEQFLKSDHDRTMPFLYCYVPVARKLLES